jgi:hypothetical protein
MRVRSFLRENASPACRGCLQRFIALPVKEVLLWIVRSGQPVSSQEGLKRHRPDFRQWPMLGDKLPFCGNLDFGDYEPG